ncbi:MAG: aldehyde dehydrogenase family protein, partial [Rhizobiaceae bacterium]
METVRIKSPVDGSVYAERPVATDAQVAAAVERARGAQAEWARVPVAERGTYMLGMLE